MITGTVKADLDTYGETVPSPVLKVDPKSKGLQNVLVCLEQVEKANAPEQTYWLHMEKDESGKEPGSQLCHYFGHRVGNGAMGPWRHTSVVLTECEIRVSRMEVKS